MFKNKMLNISLLIEIITFMAIMAIIIYKYPSPYLYKMMWAEDATVYLNQALNNPVASFFTPYAGYLLIYSRIFAGIALLFNLSFTPVIYLGGVILIYYLLVRFIFISFDISLWKKVLIALMIAFTRTEPIIFSNQANIQWFIALILLIMLASDYNFNTKIKKVSFAIFTLIIGLTGPFAVIFLPISALRIYLKKDFKDYLYFYIPFFISSIIQCATLIITPRVASNTTFQGINFYIKNLLNILGHVTSYTITSVIVFLVLLYLFVKAIRSSRLKEINYAVYLLLGGFLITLSSIVLDTNPQIWSEGNGCRYTYDLYFVIFASIILLVEKRDIVIGLIALFFSTLKSTRVFEPDIYWDSTVLFHKSVPEIYGRIAPDDWNIILENRNINSYKNPNYMLTINAMNKPVSFSAEASKICSASSDIGMIFQTKATENVPNSLFLKLSGDKNFIELSPRVSTCGNKYFAAFPIDKRDSKFNIFFPKDNSNTKYNIDVYCLGSNQ